MTQPDLPPLVTADSLATRLGLTAPPDPGSALRGIWDTALIDASGVLRDVIGQPITPATATIELDLSAGVALIPLSPVVRLLAVLDETGSAVDPDRYSNRGERRQRLLVDLPDQVITVTVSYGWDPVPTEICRWVFVLAAAQIASAGRGNLGMTGGVTSVAIDDGKVTYADASQIPERVQARLRANYGGETQ